MNGPYDDIIGLPHPDPQRRSRMPAAERAAQFAPFAALTGFEKELEKVAREHIQEQKNG